MVMDGSTTAIALDGDSPAMPFRWCPADATMVVHAETELIFINFYEPFSQARPSIAAQESNRGHRGCEAFLPFAPGWQSVPVDRSWQLLPITNVEEPSVSCKILNKLTLMRLCRRLLTH